LNLVQFAQAKRYPASISVGSATLGMRCHTNVGARFHSRTEVPDSGRARLSDEALGNCNLSSNGYLSLRASWRSFGEGVADQEDACRSEKNMQISEEEPC